MSQSDHTRGKIILTRLLSPAERSRDFAGGHYLVFGQKFEYLAQGLFGSLLRQVMSAV